MGEPTVEDWNHVPDPMPPRESHRGWFFTEEGLAKHDAELLARQAATPDGPRTWALPDEPGPEVTALNDAEGWDWKRRPDGGWCHVNRLLAHTHYQWDELLYEREGPLTDATPAAVTEPATPPAQRHAAAPTDPDAREATSKRPESLSDGHAPTEGTHQ